MKTLLPLLLLAAIAGCTSVQSRNHTSDYVVPSDAPFTLLVDTSGKYNFKSLWIFPVIAKEEFIEANSHVGPFITLKEAMDRKAIVITEMYDSVRTNGGRQNESEVVMSDNAEVNTLYIQNVGEDTVLILAGEIIKGGKQDRLIAKDFLLPPHSGKTDVSVFCVEPHRWNVSADHSSQGAVTDNYEGANFSEYKKVASNKVRQKAVKDQDQGKVWDEVKIVTNKNSASSSTGSYNALEKSPSFKNEHDEYEKFFGHKFDETENVIGVIVVSGDSVIGCDIFCTPDLFRREFINLLDAYVTDAITDQGKSKNTSAKAERYFATVAADYSDASEKPNSSKFFHAGRLIHYSSF
ncbi:MAG TPA: DUF6569 family protein [Chitinophagales bacterium]|nr:DUF6569 family protein [Chitinophagales bacterium]